jgi:hypothetical protein
MLATTKRGGGVLWSDVGGTTSLSPVTRRLAWTRVLHQEDWEGVAELIIPLELARDGWAMELDADQRWPDAVDDDSRMPASLEPMRAKVSFRGDGETPRRNRREGGGLQVALHAEALAAELETGV